jgi:hypothetical protein
LLLNPNRALGLRLHDAQQVAELALVPFEVDGCVRGQAPGRVVGASRMVAPSSLACWWWAYTSLTRTVVACERLGRVLLALPGRPRVPPAWRTWHVEAPVATDVP